MNWRIIVQPSLSQTRMWQDAPEVINSYPRARPVLPEDSARIYVQEYKINRGEGGGILYRLTQKLESWMHRRIASRATGMRLLELGAGTLNHLPFEKAGYVYDIVEPFRDLFADSPKLPRVNVAYATLDDVPAGVSYDRIFSIAVLEHLLELPTIVARSGQLIAPGGLFQAGIPAEGGLLWGLAWRLSTGIAYRLRTGLPYAPVMRHEHVNTAHDIITVLQWFFRDVRVQWFPFPAPHLSFYAYLEASAPDLNRCATFLSQQKEGRSKAEQPTTQINE